MGLFGRDKSDVEFRLNKLESQLGVNIESFQRMLESQIKLQKQVEDTQSVVSNLIKISEKHVRVIDFFLAHGVVKDDAKDEFYKMVDELKGEVKE